MDKSVHVSTRYPLHWRNTCRRVVETFVEIQTDGGKKKFGKSKLLNSIFDACSEKDQDFRREDFDRFIKRQHLEFWLEKGTEPTDQVFQFIDRFVRRLIVGPVGRILREELQNASSDAVCTGLAHLYDASVSASLLARANHYPPAQGVVFANGLSEAEKSRFSDRKEPIICIQFRRMNAGILTASVIISFASFPKDEEQNRVSVEAFRKGAIAYDAFFVLNGAEEGPEDNGDVHLSGAVAMKIAGTGNFLSKSHVPEYDFLNFKFWESNIKIDIPIGRFSRLLNSSRASTKQSYFIANERKGVGLDEYMRDLTLGYLS